MTNINDSNKVKIFRLTTANNNQAIKKGACLSPLNSTKQTFLWFFIKLQVTD
jgi:hypothetical protein